MARERFAHTRSARRALYAGLAASALGCLGLGAGACLVTQEASFEAPDRQSQVVRTYPLERTVRVPQAPDILCGGDGRLMRFETKVVDLDTEQFLRWQIYLDGAPLSGNAGVLAGREDGPEERMIRACVPYDTLSRKPCSTVTLFVTSDVEDGQYVPDTVDFSSANVEWQVLRGSLDGPDVSPADCAPAQSDAGSSS